MGGGGGTCFWSLGGGDAKGTENIVAPAVYIWKILDLDI